MHGTAQTPTLGPSRLAYKPSEVAERLGISRRSVYNLINRGELRRVTLAGRWMILAEDLDSFVAQLQAGDAA